MSSTGNSDIQRILADVMANRPYSHRQNVDPTVVAVVTVEEDMRFLPDTMGALLRQTVLPGVIVIADCAGGDNPPVQSQFQVIPAPSGLVSSVPQPKTVTVELVGVKGARSFYHGVAKSLHDAQLDSSTRAVWLLHDDSRPADDTCLESLLETWRNDPTASVLGAKQLDWQAEHLHDVGAYAYRHRVESLVVDGEPDQEQYDGRRDVFSVSLAGALVSIETMHELGGADDWFTTFAESEDFCRRVCLSGRRVVVVPQARIAHRRARFEGVRTKGGEPMDEDRPIDSSMARIRGRMRYSYTDTRLMMWPFVWVFGVFAAIGKTIAKLFAKRPYEALCELVAPWTLWGGLPRAIAARRRVSRQESVPIGRLGVLVANRQQVAQWHDRVQALSDQRHVVLLSPLAKAHLRRRAIQRWLLAVAMALVCFGVVAMMHGTTLRAVLSGASLYSDSLLPTGGDFGQLWRAATTSWAFGDGIAAPPAPWLLVWGLASVITAGNVSAAIALVTFAAAPLMALSFWAFAGVFTRSDAVRVACGLLWASFALGLGLFSAGDVPMLTVMVFLPAAFAFVFRAVGLYRTEDQVTAHPSVQAAALAALCFVPPVAAEPQLMLSLIVVFVVFLAVVPRHRAMLLLIPLPSGFVIAPTIINAVHHASEGSWRQLFGDVMVPLSARNGAPDASGFATLAMRAFGVDDTAGNGLAGLSAAGVFGIGVLVLLAVVTVLAVASLFLPFALRASRMMWVVTLSGGALAVASSRIVVAVDDDGPVAGSVLPGVVFALLGLLACVGLVSGMAVHRFSLLRQGNGSQPVLTRLEGRKAKNAKVHAVFARIGRGVLVAVLVAGAVSCTAASAMEPGSNGLHASRSDDGLPMVATDYLGKDDAHRVLAITAESSTGVRYTTMRTSRGDLMDSSPALRARVADGGHDSRDAVLSSASARLLVSADADAIADISALGYGGLYVVRPSADDGGSQATEQLISNITASEGIQSVVSNTSGVYYRLTLVDSATQRVPQDGMLKQRHLAYRYAWLVCMGVVMGLYCVVAFPRSHRRFIEEDQ